MKIQNIALPEDLKPKLVRIKWHLWRGKTDSALKRLDYLIDDCPKIYKQRNDAFIFAIACMEMRWRMIVPKHLN